MGDFNGLDVHLGNVARLSAAKTYSISAENPDGAKAGGARSVDGPHAHQARDLGPGWKISPFVPLPPASVTTLAEIEGPGAITHLWITVDPQLWRSLVLRAYWDGEETPSVEVPLGDFFCNGWTEFAQVSSVPIAVNPKGGLNSYWQMPFRRSATLTIENLLETQVDELYYQVDFVRTEIPDDVAYLHAQWRRSNPIPYGEVHTLLDGVRGQGQYVGTYLAWGCNNSGWWGEGEVKFYLDGDDEFPTICGTGTEDYFGGAWAFEHPQGVYATFTTPYLGMPQAIQSDGFARNQQRFGLYRWHIADTIRFTTDLRVTVQALGWRRDGRYLPLQDDVASTSYWYQTEPHAAFPTLPGKDYLEVI